MQVITPDSFYFHSYTCDLEKKSKNVIICLKKNNRNFDFKTNNSTYVSSRRIAQISHIN